MKNPAEIGPLAAPTLAIERQLPFVYIRRRACSPADNASFRESRGKNPNPCADRVAIFVLADRVIDNSITVARVFIDSPGAQNSRPGKKEW